MEAKKNEKLQLEKNSTLYFLIGLTLLLALTYLALEWKTFDKVFAYDPELNVIKPIDELPPILISKLPPPPPPEIQTPPELKVVNDEKDIVESVIESDDFDQDTEIPDAHDFNFEEPPIDEIFNILAVEEKPIFPGCEDATDKYVCFQEMMLRHVKKTFDYPDTAKKMGLQGKVSIMFTIQKDGSIGDVKMKGPHDILEEEANRIISKLPKMTPGKQRGKPVKVPFSIPITFRLQ